MLFYCEYNNKHYILDSGPIDLGTTGEIAIICCENLQLRAQTLEYPSLKNWLCYLDDSELKCIEPGIMKFTVETPEEDTLSVLYLKQYINRKKKHLEFIVN